MRLPVVIYGDNILRRKMKPVENFEEATELVDDMFDTMYEEDGIGLAANQIARDLNLMVVDITHTDEWDIPFAFVNGEILERWGESVMEEGCLSLPEIRVEVKRAEKVRFAYQDLNGEKHVNEYTGLMARVIQHEMDHLNGRVIVDHASPLQKQRFSSRLKELESGHGGLIRSSS